MKKLSLMLAAFALVLGLSQCKKQDSPLQIGERQHIVLAASNGNDGSKVAVDFATTPTVMNLTWEENDEITVTGGAEGTLKLENGAGTGAGHFSGDVTVVSGADLVFSYRKANREGSGEEINYNEQAGTVEWIKDNLYLTGSAPYNEFQEYTVTMEMPYAVLKLNMMAFVATEGNDVTVKQGGTTVATVKDVQFDNSDLVYMAFPIAGGKKTYTFEGNGKTFDKSWELVANTYYTAVGGAAIVIEEPVESDEWVNFNDASMGVEGMPLWGKYNVGVVRNNLNSIEDWRGMYLAWGAIAPAPQNNYNWQNCPGNGGYADFDYTSFVSWKNQKLANGVLKQEVDAANYYWGGKWRTPTGGENSGEWKQLMDNTYWKRTENYKGISGLNGYVVYKVKDASDKGKINGTPSETYSTDEDPHIFLPFGGYRTYSNLYDPSSTGMYWSSSLNTTNNKAWSMVMMSSPDPERQNTDSQRIYGYFVRPVRPLH